MSPIALFPTTPTPLPQAPGPKLAPFTPTATAKRIQFIERLGETGEGEDGHVWKVRINGRKSYYALKMFKFNPAGYLKSCAPFCRPFASTQHYVNYLDPFNCECRAYGRLKEENREDLAIQAHGYLLLTPHQEAAITKKITGFQTPSELNGEDFWHREEEHRQHPVRAIVKELASSASPFTPKQLPDMWKDLEDLHSLGILVRDITVFNYIGGKLIEFSRAWATPHPYLEYMPPRDLKKQLRSDPRNLERTMIEWGTGNKWNWEKIVIPEELQDCTEGEGRNGPDGYGIDPSQYDWRRWEKDAAAADGFLEENLFADETTS